MKESFVVAGLLLLMFSLSFATAAEDSYDAQIREYSSLYNLDFNYVKSVIKQESNFNPTAVSPSGARGLMQIMPATFNSIAKGMGYDNPDPFDTDLNIRVGTYYLSNVLRRHVKAYNYFGSAGMSEASKTALAGYNGGYYIDAALQVWLREGGYYSGAIDGLLGKKSRAAMKLAAADRVMPEFNDLISIMRDPGFSSVLQGGLAGRTPDVTQMENYVSHISDNYRAYTGGDLTAYSVAPTYAAVDESCSLDEFCFEMGSVFSNAGCLEELDLGEDYIDYEYYNEECAMSEAFVNTDEEVYRYNIDGNLLSEEYRENPEYNRNYEYDSYGRILLVEGDSSRINYQYSSDASYRETVLIDAYGIPVSYTYSGDGELIGFESADLEASYSYGECGLVSENVVSENGGILSATYGYDSNCNIEKYDDGVNLPVYYTYKDIPYSCVNEAGADDTCYYQDVDERIVGNQHFSAEYVQDSPSGYNTKIRVAYDDSLVEEADLEVAFDDSGKLVEDEYYNYNYLGDELASKTSKYSGDVVNFDYYDNGLAEVSNYDDGSYLNYFYDPLDRLIKVDSYSPDGSSASITGSVIALFTGFVTGEPSGMTKTTYYATIPGQIDSLRSEEQLKALPKDKIILPPTPEDYNIVFDFYDFNGMFAMWDNPAYWNFCDFNSCTEYFFDAENTYSGIIYISSMSDVADENVIAVGNPCSETTLYLDDFCSPRLSEGNGQIVYGFKENKEYVLILGLNSEDISMTFDAFLTSFDKYRKNESRGSFIAKTFIGESGFPEVELV